MVAPDGAAGKLHAMAATSKSRKVPSIAALRTSARKLLPRRAAELPSLTTPPRELKSELDDSKSLHTQNATGQARRIGARDARDLAEAAAETRQRNEAVAMRSRARVACA